MSSRPNANPDRRRPTRKPARKASDSLREPTLYSDYVVEFLRKDQTAFLALPKRFVRELSDDESAAKLAFNNFAVVSLQSRSSQEALVKMIVQEAAKPFKIVSLCPAMNEHIRGRKHVWRDHVWNLIDQIALDHVDVYWWVTIDGLVIRQLTDEQLASARESGRMRAESVSKQLDKIGAFARIAGRLFRDAMENGKVSDPKLLQIALQLGGWGFSLREHLRPSDWKPLAEQNQKYARHAVKTFAAAAKKSPRALRRALSAAKRKYEKALAS